MLEIALDKTPTELDQLVPRDFLDSITPPCRLEKVKPLSHTFLEERNVDVLLDVCHNEQGLSSVLQELTSKSQKPITVIFGASIGKKVGNLLKVMEQHSSRIKSINCVENRDHPRLQTLE